jgi:hypothetical protein
MTRLHPVIVRYRARGFSHPWYDLWEERAAIMEYDGGMSRDEAEWQAYVIVLDMQQPAPERLSGNKTERK